MLGYVDTGYFGTTGRTTRDGQTSVAAWTAQVDADVADWYSWYGSSGLTGIFFDDALGDCGAGNAHVDLYTGINSTTKQTHPGAFTVDNPGSPAESVLRLGGRHPGDVREHLRDLHLVDRARLGAELPRPRQVLAPRLRHPDAGRHGRTRSP